jgi:hypothetical protein
MLASITIIEQVHLVNYVLPCAYAQGGTEVPVLTHGVLFRDNIPRLQH